jgi:Uncharacterized conserved protein (some members contain a von Willebrand factor type A (vWA) domain)
VAAGAIATSDSVLLDAVRNIRWAARRKAPAGPAGAHLSNMLGTSAEFTEYRAYRQGDETRRIDWKLLARSNRAYIRLSNDRTIVPTMLLVDASASLAYPAVTFEKWHYARQLSLGLASAAHSSGDPVGLAAVTGKDVRRLPARTRRGSVYEIARVLDSIRPLGSSQLAVVLPTLRSAGRIAIVSDFLGDADALLKIASHLTAAGKEVARDPRSPRGRDGSTARGDSARGSRGCNADAAGHPRDETGIPAAVR